MNNKMEMGKMDKMKDCVYMENDHMMMQDGKTHGDGKGYENEKRNHCYERWNNNDERWY